MSDPNRQENTDNYGKLLILIVDDDPDILMMTSRILQKAGFKVIEGSSGEECLSLAKEHKPELILLDVVMPDINGIEVCQRIKNDKTLRNSFLILMSGQRTTSDEQADGLTCGADGYIARPISQRELIARVEIMLRLRKAQIEKNAHSEALIIERNKLRQAVKEKDFLMRELNHRVKNNLQMISSLIGLKDSMLGNQVDLSDINSQIDAIRMVHEKLYQTNKIDLVNVRDYFSDLVSSLFSTFSSHKIQVDLDIEPISVSTKTVVTLGLIINEITTNAIKYGFNNADDLIFTMKMKQVKESQYILTLSNTGNPFPENIDLENSDTLGLRLISALVNQLSGTIELQKEPYPVFTIHFSVEE